MTADTFNSIRDIPRYVIQTLDDHGLPGWGFEWMVSSTTLGQARTRTQGYVFTRRSISLSTVFVRACLPDHQHEIVDTILHEVAHASVGLHHRHDDAWKEKCVEIGARPERFKDLAKIPTLPYRWVGECYKGHHDFKRARLTKSTRSGTCAKCDAADGTRSNAIVWRRNPMFDLLARMP